MTDLGRGSSPIMRYDGEGCGLLYNPELVSGKYKLQVVNRREAIAQLFRIGRTRSEPQESPSNRFPSFDQEGIRARG